MEHSWFRMVWSWNNVDATCKSFNFSEGHLNFSIKIPSNISFQIGIIDAWGNQSYVNFPCKSNYVYGLVRNGDWGHASIAISDIRGEH